ncbi:MAG: hypothetical protein ACI9CD_000956, partial [Candidatus Deianiraeaceae bacterium]
MGNFLKKFIEATITQSLLGIFKGKLVHITALFLCGVSVFLSYFSPAFDFFGYPLIIAWVFIMLCLWLCAWYWWSYIKHSLHSKKQMSVIEMDREKSYDTLVLTDLATLNATDETNIADHTKELATLKTYFPFIKTFPEETSKQIIKYLAYTELGVETLNQDTPLTNTQYDRMGDVLDGYLSYRQEEVKELLKKIGQNIAEDKECRISKKAIEFLSSITATDLGILKKQFKYVRRAGIEYFDSIIDFIKKVDSDAVSPSYSLKFYGDIWKDEYLDGGVKCRQYKKEQFGYCELVEISGKQYSNVYASMLNGGYNTTMIIPEQHY